MPPTRFHKVALVLLTGLTLSRLFAGILSSYLFVTSADGSRLLVALCGYILVSDLLDGHLARRLNLTTKAGAILDYGIDRLNIYLVISSLLHRGAPVWVFAPYLARDLISIATQSYMALPKISGTKWLSIGGTISCYLYMLAINFNCVEITVASPRWVLFCLLLVSLFNMMHRIWRVRRQLVTALAEDLGFDG